MKPILKSILCFLLLLPLFIGNIDIGRLVLCIESDGHVFVETPHSKHYCHPSGQFSHTLSPLSPAIKVVSAGHDEPPCMDIPISIGNPYSPVISSGTLINAPVVLASAGSFLGLTEPLKKMIFSDFTPHIKTSNSYLDTIILLI